jgi:hypothetical protein
MELKDIVDRIHMLTLDEVNEVLRAANARRSYMASVAFKIGDTVEFSGGPRRWHRRGQIIKMNIKRYQVRTTDGLTWNVPPSMLRKFAVTATVSA